MKKNLQKRTGYFLSVLAFLLAVMNFISLIFKLSFREAFFNIYVIPLLIVSCLCFISGFFQSLILRYTQVGVMGVIAAVSLYDGYDSFFGYAILVLFVATADRFGFFSKYRMQKAVVLVLIYFFVIVSSASIANEPISTALGTVLFLLGIGSYTVLLYKEKERVFYKGEIDNSNDENLQIRQKLEESERENKELKHKLAQALDNKRLFPIDDINLSNAEKRVLKDLCLNGGSNKTIAERLCISESTVKTHLNHIYRKSCINDRWTLREAFRNNFSL